MTPVTQEFPVDHDGGRRGDCVRAAIASLLDLPLADVPHFVQIDADGGPNWWEHITSWLHHRGLALYAVDPADPRLAPRPGEHYWVSGGSPRGHFTGPDVFSALHAVVYRDEELAHDPHPDGGGVVTVLERWAIRPLPANGDQRSAVLSQGICPDVEHYPPELLAAVNAPAERATVAGHG